MLFHSCNPEIAFNLHNSWLIQQTTNCWYLSFKGINYIITNLTKFLDLSQFRYIVLRTLSITFSRRHFEIFFLYFQAIRIWQLETFCRKCQILFSGKNKKNIFKTSSAERFTQHAERQCYQSLDSVVSNQTAHFVYEQRLTMIRLVLPLNCQSQLLSSALSSACDFKSHFCKQCGPQIRLLL